MGGDGLVYLLKSGRKLQYRQQNVAIVSAEEGAEFETFYANRWLPEPLRVHEGDGAVVVLGDTPYAHIDPIRYATIVEARHTRAGLTVRFRCGPPVVVTGPAALVPPPPRHPAGGRHFVWRGAGEALRPPGSDDELHDAWRAAIDRLRDNAFYAASHFARLVRLVDGEGVALDGRRLRVGAEATAVLEVHSPVDDRYVTVIVDSDPPGGLVGGVNDALVAPGGRLEVPVRALTAGRLRGVLSFAPQPLLSTRIALDVEVHPVGAPVTDVSTVAIGRREPTGTGAGAAAGTADTDRVVALAQRLRRLELDPDQYLDLLVGHILPLAPDDRVLRSLAAQAAFDVRDFDLVVHLLDDPDQLRPGDAFRRLVAGLHTSANDDVGAHLRAIDLAVDQTVTELAAELVRLPAGALRTVVESLLDELAGDELLDRLLRDVFSRLGDDLAVRVARDCAPADPETWLHRVLDKWSPTDIPADALGLLVDWEMHDPALQPYVLEAVERALDTGDLDDLDHLRERAAGLLPDRERTELRLAVARLLRGAERLDEAAGELVIAADEVIGLGDTELCLRVHAALTELDAVLADGDTNHASDAGGSSPPIRAEIETRRRRLERILDESPAVRDYRAARDAEAARDLRRHTNGRILHLVGGKRAPWADELREALGLADLVWHESEYHKSPPTDWAPDLDRERCTVVLFWDQVGHDTTRRLDRAGVPYLVARLGKRALLETLREALGDHPDRGRPTG
ncbi:MAG: hypothetical protein D6683_12385 [Actinomyces sp.]|nr:MAG: hypothetical protein D6683_12385 [Actinomyces sp.]